MKKFVKPLITVLLVAALLVPTIAMIYSSAISLDYPVELNFENLFSFEAWASNDNSTKVVGGSEQGVGTLTTDIDNGSFTITRTSTNTDITQVYTGHGMDKENAIANMDYYKVNVEPNTTYSLSYNFGSSSTVSPDQFFITLFMFDADNLCLVWGGTAPKSTGDNSFIFTTPANTTMLQMRFGLNGTDLVSAEISEISLNKCNVVTDSANLFVFDTWATSSSGTTVGAYGGAVYADGTSVANTDEDSILMTVNAGGSLFTGFDLTTTNGFYMIPATANTSYVLSYNLVNSMNTDFENFAPYVVKVSTSGVISYAEGIGTVGYGAGSCVFTTDSDTAYITPVFSAGAGADGWVVKVTDIKLMAAEIDENKHDPHRLVKTYGVDETYGTLPTPSYIPDGYVFAGWCTNEDGSGMRITADTAVQPQSLTVYPRYELAVDSLTVKTLPDKTIYTLGETLDTTGLVLEATVTETVTTESDTNNNGVIEDSEITTETITSTFEIPSGYYCTPDTFTASGTQTVTASYGGKSATFNVTVKSSDPGTVIVNGVSQNVTIANNEYTFNLTGLSFNRYEVTYKSDSYVSGVATFNDGLTEDFFLEPSESGSFGSYINDFLEDNKYTEVVSIKFTTLDKQFGSFELVSLNTVSVANPGNSVYYSNHKFEMGIALDSGGVVSELYDISDDIYARTYSTTHNYQDGNGNVTVNRTQVDYKDKLDENYGSGYNGQSTKVNLINTLDQGRFLQQSYYGSGEKPYIQSEYNNAAWPYNPVQGGNVIGDKSKIIDYKVADTYVYVKARPLDWAKWSDEYANTANREGYDPIWGDDYITDTYVEAWYYFQGDTIKVVNRKVDYSGLADAVHSQEFPALYLIEPLNHFVYNNVSEEEAWTKDSTALTQQDIEYSISNWSVEHEDGKLINMEEPEYWGLTQMYISKKGMDGFEPWVNCNENWAAFTASEDPDSFGVGIYTERTNKFYYGVQPAVYQQTAGDMEGSVGDVLDTLEYRHTKTTNPSPELPTSYIAPTDTMTFRSYEPTEFTYYLATGTASEIRDEFKTIADGTTETESRKPKVAVPETVYLKPTTDGNYTEGQYYATNILNPNNFYNVETKVEYTDMYLGVYAQGGQYISVSVSNVTNPSEDINVCASDDSTSAFDGVIFEFTDDTDANDGTFIFPAGLDLDFASGGGLAPGEQATARWDIVVYYGDPNDSATEKETLVAYSVLYAPHRTVGAVAEARQVNASQHELSSWITGANGVDHSTRSPLGSFHGDYRNSGYFREDPLVYTNPPTDGSGGTAYDYILGYGTANGSSDDYHDNAYVMQTATNDHDSSRSQSYLGLLAIDNSRYTNTDQIPNLRIGWDALRIGSYTKNSLGKYNTYYTVGTDTAYTATSLSEAPSGWTTYSSYTDIADSYSIPYRESFVPSYTVSSLDGKYLHAIAQGESDQTINSNQYATAGTSVLIDVTDKSELRDSVTDAYGVTDPSEEFLEKLEDAATVLGDPSASQEEIDNANDALKEDLEEILNVVYALKYDNLFSAHEFSQHSGNMTMSQPDYSSVSYSNGTLTVVNEAMTAGETYSKYGTSSDYYRIDLEPNTEYVFEYDVTTTVNSQAFLFFYNSNDANSEPATNIAVQIDRNGTWTSKTEGNSWIGNYQNGAGTKHYAIKFTTGATTTQVGFRFGNTSSSATTSTFSNIKLIDSARYYEDVTYTATETAHKEYTSYGALQIPTRVGYAFGGWVDANGTTVTGSDVAVDNQTIYSVWSIINYNITYNANGGSVNPTSQTYTVNDTLTLPTPTRDGYVFQGWKVTSAEGSWAEDGICPAGEIPVTMYGNAVLTAQWSIGELHAYFDTVLDFSKWNTTTASNATFSNVTSNGFTLTSNAGAGEGTSSSPYFAVEPGKSYKIDIDITGDAWDVYIFFCDANGNWIDFQDSTNRYAANGHGPADRVFTAPNKSEVVKAQIRVDANGSNNSVTFSDIRVYEATTCASNVDVPYSSKEVTYASTFGELPVPTREGYTFLGWYDGDTLITADSSVTQTSDIYLKSKWQLADTALTADSAVIDFSTPITIDAVANDTIFTDAATIYGATASIVGVSTDGDAYTSTANGKYGIFKVENGNIVYTPTSVVNGIETVYYHTQLDKGDSTVVKSQITVAPASNVLYEENVFTVTGTGRDWNHDGTTVTENQDPSTVNDVYGYDSNAAGYNQLSNYSNGSALKVTVSETYKRSKNIKFDFTGEGFDLNGACGLNTGVLVVTLRDNDYKNDEGEKVGKMVKSYIVDTYYSDLDDKGIDRYSNTLYQVPLISENGLEHSNYTVQIVASYLPTMSGAINNRLSTQAVDDMPVGTASYTDNESLREALAEAGLEHVLDAESVEVIWFDENSIFNGGEGVNTFEEGVVHTQGPSDLLTIIDSVRVYNPLEDGNSYYISSETNAQYYNVIDNLVNVKDGNIITPDNGGNFAYVSGNDANEISVEKYAEIGPKDELYLSKASFVDNKAVTFTINGFDKNSMKVMVSLRAASGIPTAKFGGSQFTVDSNTEMYYDITDYIAEDGTVTIQNVTEKTLLSVGTLKITSEAIETASLSTEFNLMTARTMMMAPAEDVEPNIPDAEPEEPVIPEEPSEDDSSSECWLVRFFNWLISMFTKFIDFIKGILSL